MKPITLFLISGTERSKEIARLFELGSDVKELSEITELNGYFPVLICGDGYEHYYNHYLSKLIDKKLVKGGYGDTFIKVQNDAHIDLLLSLSENPKHLSYGNHLSHSLKECDRLKRALITGYKDAFHSKIISPQFGKKVIYQQELPILDEVKGENIHQTIDFDVLRECSFCHFMFHREVPASPTEELFGPDRYKGPFLKDLVEQTKNLKNRNNILGIDICGLDLTRKDTEVREGIDAYKKILEIFKD